MVPENIKEIARRFLSGTATEEEIALLHQWYDAWTDDETVIQTYTEDPAIIEARMLSRMLEQMREKNASPAPVVTLPKRKWWKVAVAAAVIMALGLSLFLWQQRLANDTARKTFAVTDTASGIRPGIAKAMLILADGRQVVLDTTATGVISKQGNTTVINSNGQLTYDGANNQQEAATYYNTVKTGTGNQYQLVLPDGSRVWLNAASALRFPTKFSEKERVVELTGEGYFEVAHLSPKGEQGKTPFIVKFVTSSGNGGEVQVLGTHFNINAYDDEEAIKTTLLEGSVKVVNREPAIGKHKAAILKPGEQVSISQSSQLSQPIPVQTEEAVAWKNGYFQFTDAPITTVMRQVARWYNITVVYNGNVQQEIFSGTIPRSASITQLIKILEFTKTVKVNMEGRKFIVGPY